MTSTSQTAPRAGGAGGARVTILGSGTCVPSLRRSSCAALVAAGETRLLLDCGAGTMRRLLRAGTAPHEIRHILLSHLHPDHSGELASFLFGLKYGRGPRPSRPLTLVAARGFGRFFRDLQALYGQWLELPPDRLRILELDREAPAAGDARRIDLGDFALAWAPVEHTDLSLAYRLTAPDGASVVYSGDTEYCRSLVDLAGGADLFICECALPDADSVAGHLTPSAAGRIAAEAGVKKLVLTHFYPECDTADIIGQCRKTWSGPLFLAEDLMQLTP